MVSGMVRQESSKPRILCLSMVPARYMPAAALWIALKASLLYLRLLFMAYLHEFFELHFPGQVVFGFPGM